MFKSPLSAFTPCVNSSHVVIGSSSFIQSDSFEDSNEKSTNSPQTRVWNDEMTMYVMLKYRRWQIKGRKELTLSQFHKTCAQSLFDDFRIHKTPTQIRDKVNNTKSAYSNLKKKVSNGNFTWKQEKSTVLPRKLFKFWTFTSLILLSMRTHE
ncbi:Myb/SANT-like domain-containing protein [Entamoeba marina]